MDAEPGGVDGLGDHFINGRDGPLGRPFLSARPANRRTYYRCVTGKFLQKVISAFGARRGVAELRPACRVSEIQHRTLKGRSEPREEPAHECFPS